jgi:hypothetical protein
MNSVHHTYIFESGIWQRDGESFFNEMQESYPVKEMIRCERDTARWTVVSEKTILRDPPSVSFQHLNIAQNSKISTQAMWSLKNPQFGKMEGSFTILDGKIISRWFSEKGFSSYALLTKTDDQTYQEDGFACTQTEKISEQWTAVVKKLESPKGQ